MESILVSVIIPVYNTASYIRETLECICAQTLREIEIIAIDDGSTDNSLEIIREQANKDPRIKVCHQNVNQGPSGSRNWGVRESQGKYIYFMDSDDLLAPKALETCYQKCIQENLDFVFFDAICINTHNKYTGQSYTHQAYPGSQIQKGINWLKYQLDTSTFRVPVWLNFIRHDYLKQLNLSFFPGIIHEDQLYTLLLYINASKVSYIPQIFPQHRLRDTSIMGQQFTWKNIEGYFTTFQQISCYRKNKSPEIQTILDKYFRITLNAVIWQARTLPSKEKFRIFRICIKEGYLKYLKPKYLAVMFLKH